jgi:hypothetical protein
MGPISSCAFTRMAIRNGFPIAVQYVERILYFHFPRVLPKT